MKSFCEYDVMYVSDQIKDSLLLLQLQVKTYEKKVRIDNWLGIGGKKQYLVEYFSRMIFFPLSKFNSEISDGSSLPNALYLDGVKQPSASQRNLKKFKKNT